MPSAASAADTTGRGVAGLVREQPGTDLGDRDGRAQARERLPEFAADRAAAHDEQAAGQGLEIPHVSDVTTVAPASASIGGIVGLEPVAMTARRKVICRPSTSMTRETEESCPCRAAR